MSLSACQLSFLSALHLGGRPPPGLLRGEAPGWAIYQAGYLHNLVEALRDVYPVTDRLVGRPCFTHLARSYLRRHPSTQADLHGYGAGFANCLRDCEALAGLPYLPDVARLEWLAHEAFHAADAAPLTEASLARLLAEPPTDLALPPHPSLRLMRSDFPVHRIWQVNQPHWTGGQDVDLGLGGVCLAVYRDGLEIAILPLEPAAHALALAMMAGRGLGEALEHVQDEWPAAEPGRLLHALIHHRLLADPDIPPETGGRNDKPDATV